MDKWKYVTSTTTTKTLNVKVRDQRLVGSVRSGGKRRRASKTVSHLPPDFVLDILEEERYPGASSVYMGPPGLDKDRSVLVVN